MSEIISGVELAGYLDVLPSTVADLAAKDRVVRVARGRYELKASIRRYCGHLKEAAAGRPGTRADLTAEKVRLTKAQADMAEMASAARARTMVDVKEFEDAWAHDMVLVRQAMLGVTARIVEAIPHLSRHDTMLVDDTIRDALTRAADDRIAQLERQDAADEAADRPTRKRRRR